MSSLESDQKSSKHIAEEAVADSEVILIQNEKYNTEKYNTEKYNTHVQREVELSPPELSMIEKRPKQIFIDTCLYPLI